MSSTSRLRSVVLFLAILPLTGCLWRNHIPVRTASTAPLKTATQAELIDYINGQAAKVQSMNATVDIDTTVGGEKKGKVTDYQQIRGYVLARKPEMLRMIGLLPIVRTKALIWSVMARNSSYGFRRKTASCRAAMMSRLPILSSRWRTCARSIFITRS